MYLKTISSKEFVSCTNYCFFLYTVMKMTDEEGMILIIVVCCVVKQFKESVIIMYMKLVVLYNWLWIARLRDYFCQTY